MYNNHLWIVLRQYMEFHYCEKKEQKNFINQINGSEQQ